tara:strand:- start:5503 stop:6225 length:723 start_codon:yes stop_codon:yes gene_type:complete
MSSNRKILSDFKDIHHNEDIYVVASGKSIDLIDTDFYSNKITIGVNQTYKKFLPTYSLRKESHMLGSVVDAVVRDNPDLFLFISRDCGGVRQKGRIRKNLKIVNEKFSDLDNIVIYNTIKNIGYKKIQNKHVNNDNHLLATETTLHTAIHLACYMGAKNIILVGHDCTTILGEPNFEGYHTDKSYRIKHKNGKKTYSEWIGRLWVRTRELKKVLKCKFDVNLVSINPFPSLKQLVEFIEK